MLSHKHKNHIHTHLGNADDGSQAMHEVLIDGNDYSSTCPVAIWKGHFVVETVWIV